ncbi:hypothetical protein [Hymenobacter negativus]|uniref:Uncharacterized protein n=1 Tax=Hymenobacter negativus TaxID=2795026 RepID=A0ABS3QD87_9BACT|nr:hypothetical protein [Hymenobacter negativus]MBO2009195.1 hypothetical protein [Hymenobacter negativus]
MPRQKFTGFVDARHQRIYADSWLHLPSYDREVPEWLERSYVWRVVGFSRRCLKLEAYGIPAEVELVHEGGRHVQVFHPSQLAVLSDYPEEWGWWQGAGWGILLAYGRDGGVRLEGRRRHDWLHLHLPAEAAADPERVRRWLQHALFAQIHPVKAQRLTQPDGYFPQAEVDAMVRRLRRAEK